MIFNLPDLVPSLPVYMFGTGLNAISFTRQMKQQGVINLLEGYLETEPSVSSFLGLRVYGVNQLSKEQIKESAFLIASDKYSSIFVEQLIKIGVEYQRIIVPNKPSWKVKYNGFSADNKKTLDATLYPPINDASVFERIYKTILKRVEFYSDVKVQINISFDFFIKLEENKKIVIKKIICANEINVDLQSSDLILLWDAKSLIELSDDNLLSKIYFVSPFSVSRIVKLCRYFKPYVEQANHERRLKKLVASVKELKRVKVLFLVYDSRVWKVDSLFQRMMQDSFFDPIILVCPRKMFGEDYMRELMNKTFSFFKDKNYPVLSSYLIYEERWVNVDEIKPDIVFFASPYKQNQDYFESVYSNYLSCYVPYFFMATNHVDNNFLMYNYKVIRYMWKVYWPHDVVLTYSKENSLNKAVNGTVVGYPAMENIFKYMQKGVADREDNHVWRNNNKKKIIYAPHHTIHGVKGFTSTLSTFLELGDYVRELAEYFKDQVDWSFKPHPNLKPKLYLHPDWGKNRTDEYYRFWGSQEYTQLEDGEYDDLFVGSDAIIHDCSSFIAEYAFTEKPSLYLLNEKSSYGLLNEFGKGVMQTYELATTRDEVKMFVERVVSETAGVEDSKRSYFNDYLSKYYQGKLPSERIIDDLKSSFCKYN